MSEILDFQDAKITTTVNDMQTIADRVMRNRAISVEEFAVYVRLQADLLSQIQMKIDRMRSSNPCPDDFD
jgi:hypothetical protein